MQRQSRRAPGSNTVVRSATLALCVAVGLLCPFGAFVWYGFCQEGNFERCLDGHASVELVFQFVLVSLAIVPTVAARLLALRSQTRLSWTAIGATLMLLLAWVVFLDAATHGWDDLKYF